MHLDDKKSGKLENRKKENEEITRRSSDRKRVSLYGATFDFYFYDAFV